MVASSISLPPTPSPTSALSVAGRAGHAFTPQAMLQGFVCHARGVELPAAGPARVHARVRSKRTHDVHLRAEQGRLVVACSCPARSFGLDVCKHVWAALLEVDRHDALGDLRKARGPIVVVPAPPPPAPPAKNETANETTNPEIAALGATGPEQRPVLPAREKAASSRRATEAASNEAPRPKALAKAAPPPKKPRAEKAHAEKSNKASDKREVKKTASSGHARASTKPRPRTAKRR